MPPKLPTKSEMSGSTSKPAGSLITVDGYGAQNWRDVINAIDIIFPDGTKIFAGSSGTGAPREGPR